MLITAEGNIELNIMLLMKNYSMYYMKRINLLDMVEHIA